MSSGSAAGMRLLAVMALGLGLLVAQPAMSMQDTENKDICRTEILRAEKKNRFPRYLFLAIAQAESGIWRKRERDVIAWPWTVYAEGRGRRYASKEEAIAAVRALRARGVRNIDVGCMQVNLRHHAAAFSSLEEAFDPAVNTAYAAGFFGRLFRETRSWTRSVRFYHSRNVEKSRPYQRRVFRLWQEERRRQARLLAARVREQAAARRAAYLARYGNRLRKRS